MEGRMKGPDPNGVHQTCGADELRRRLDEARQFDQRGPETNGNGAHHDNSAASPRPDTKLPACSDEALALKYAAKHANDLRYTASWGRWQHFDGKRWRNDTTLLAMDHARQICRQALAAAKADNERKDTASAKKRAAVVSLAREDRRLAATCDQWDSDPCTLNTPSGVIDLHTFKSRPQRPTDYFTKITAVGREEIAHAGVNFLKRSPAAMKLSRSS